MKVYIANLGEGNAYWPVCRTENVLTLETSARLLDFWKRNDRSGWLSWATQNERMINGQKAIPAVASRWFNLITIFHEPSGTSLLDQISFWTGQRNGYSGSIGKPETIPPTKEADTAVDKSIWRRSQSLVALNTP